MLDSNYHAHLYFESDPSSREYKLNKCIEVLGLIARLKDRNTLGIGNEAKNNEMIARLKSYYNYCLDGIDKF